MAQLILPLDFGAAGLADDFIVTPSNEDALRQLADLDNWPFGSAILTGPARSGKSSLAQLIAQRQRVDIVDGADSLDDEALFHRWNQAQQNRRPILMVARTGPADWGLDLPDLKSRLAASLAVSFQPPDDAMIRALLLRHVRVRGSLLADPLADYAAARLERRYDRVEMLAELLHRASLEKKKPIGQNMVRLALAALQGDGNDTEASAR